MKYVLVIVLLAGIGTLLYWRLRPYLTIVRKFLGFVRDVRSMRAGGVGTEGMRARAGESGSSVEKLVRCASCGTWLPASRVVSVRSSSATYCSHECLERAAEAETNRTSLRG